MFNNQKLKFFLLLTAVISLIFIITAVTFFSSSALNDETLSAEEDPEFDYYIGETGYMFGDVLWPELFVTPEKDKDRKRVYVYEPRGFFERFSTGFDESGLVEYDHEYKYSGGKLHLVATGIGRAGGGLEVFYGESPVRLSFRSSESHLAYTDPGAGPEEYMNMVASLEAKNAGKARTEVEPKPGETSHIKQFIATNKDEVGTYVVYENKVNTGDSITDIQYEISGVSSTIRVDGHADVKESVVRDSGGSGTGWWDLD